MKIKKLGIGGYGKFIDSEITFTGGLNLVFGRNEAGKSTLQAFIKAMLFDHSRENIKRKEGLLPDRKKYEPWNGDSFGGIMQLETDDGAGLKITRDFSKKDASVFDSNLRDVTGEFPYSSREGLRVGEKLLNMDRECFENSAFIRQGDTIVHHDDRKNLFEKMMNLSLTGEEDTSAAVAKDALSKAVTGLGNSRTKNRPYNLAMKEFQRLSAQKEIADRMREEMSENIIKRENLEKEIKSLEKKISEYHRSSEIGKLLSEQAELQIIKEKYDNYTIELEGISKEIFELRQKLEKSTLPESIREDDILENTRICVSGAEKLKTLMNIDADKELGKLQQFKKTKIIRLFLSAAGVVATALVALFTHPAVFVLTAASLTLFIYVFISKPGFIEKELTEQIKVKDELRCDLALVNTFIEASGFDKANSFESAEAILNALFDIKKDSDKFENQIKRLEDRKADLTKYRDGVTGSSTIDGLSQRLIELKEEISKADSTEPYYGPDPRIEYDKKRSELSGVTAVLDKYIQDEDEAAVMEESLEAIRGKLDEIDIEKQAMEIASSMIDEAARGLQEEIIPRLNDKTGEILDRITSGVHSSLHAGLDNEINTEFDNNIRSLWQFSDGTIDQMYLALRIAASDVFSEKETVPVIIDEAFAYYDEDRIRNAFEILSDIARDRQVIVFTCKEQEVELASRFNDVNIIRL